MLKKILSAFLLLVLLLIISLYVYISHNINLAKQQFRTEAQIYLQDKYNENAIISTDVSIMDEKTAMAYFETNPELTFFVSKTKLFHDTYLQKCLCVEAENLLREAFSSYDSKIYVSDLKWCNPTQDGKNETFLYLEHLYKQLGRVPVWKDINEYQKIQKAKVSIKGNLDNENDILQAIQHVKKSGCHIESLEVIDASGKTYEYTF